MELPDRYMTRKEARYLDVFLGIKSQEENLIFRYLRADGEQVDVGFFHSRGEAQTERDNHLRLGYFCTEIIEVSKDYKLRN